MITEDTTAYLGGYGTEDQQQLFQDAADRLKELYLAQHPDGLEDLPDMIASELSGAAQYALGDSTLTSLGAEVKRLERAYLEALDVMGGAMVAASVQGLNEMQIVRMSGLSRATVRKRIGK